MNLLDKFQLDRKTAIQLLGFVFLIYVITIPIGCQQNESVASSSTSKWIKIDDFESPELWNQWIMKDTKNNTKPRIESPQVTEVRSEDDGQNNYLIKKPAADGVVGNRKALSYRKLPVSVDVGETYTFYTRINVNISRTTMYSV